MAYCTPSDVSGLLAAFDVSATWATTAAIEARALALLPEAQAIVDGLAGRDFEEHEADSFSVDGTGTNFLFLRPYGKYPILALNTLTVSDTTITVAEVALYKAEGYLRLKDSAETGSFPAGIQNVDVDLDWGYAKPPADVKGACARVIAALMLGQVRGAGATGDVTQRRLGDFSVSYGKDSPYAGTIEAWLSDVERATDRYRDGAAMI